MPPAVIRLLCSFYDGQERLLCYRGSCARSWVQASRGLVQGCLLSLLIGSAVMAVWSRFMEGPQAFGLSLQDDRTLVARPAHGEVQRQALALASRRSLM